MPSRPRPCPRRTISPAITATLNVALAAAIPMLGCASGSMAVPEDVGLGDGDSTGDSSALPTPDPTFDSAEDGSDTGGADTGGTTRGATSNPVDDDDDDDEGDETSDNGTTGAGPTDGDSTGSDDGGTTAVGSEEGSSDDSGGESGSTGAELVTLDISGWRVIQTNSSREYEFPPGTVIEAGTAIVIGRDASQPAFEDWWSVTMDDDVVYFDSGNMLYMNNGDETFTVRDDSDAIVDGPTPPLTLGSNAQRSDAGASGSDVATWTASPNPNGEATPGSGEVAAAADPVLVLTELSDANGSGAFPYEFVELRFVVP